jgi:hypothetical protein
MPTLDDTIALARQLHEGVVDLTGTPYIEHPLWVMHALPDDATDDDRHLAMLHDVIEDCRARLAVLMEAMPMTFDPANPMGYLDFFRRRGYSSYVVEGLMLLTRDMWHGLAYRAYIQNIIQSGHHGAILVKYMDTRHNGDEARLAQILPEHQHRVASLRRRYQPSNQALATALGLA